MFPRTGLPSLEVNQTESGPVFLKTETPQTSRSLKRNQDSDGAGGRVSPLLQLSLLTVTIMIIIIINNIIEGDLLLQCVTNTSLFSSGGSD